MPTSPHRSSPHQDIQPPGILEGLVENVGFDKFRGLYGAGVPDALTAHVVKMRSEMSLNLWILDQSRRGKCASGGCENLCDEVCDLGGLLPPAPDHLAVLSINFLISASARRTLLW